MSEKHTIVNHWSPSDFPFDHTDNDRMDAIQSVLPKGYWFAYDYSAEEDYSVVLMKNEAYTND